MFTGIIEEMGVMKELNRGVQSAQMSILAKAVLGELSVGDSIAVNGVCLTVIARTETDFRVDISSETLTVTTLGSFKVGDAVNLERSLRLGSRLGGHFVTGHIDGIGSIRQRQQDDNTILFSIEAVPQVLRFCVRKGSIAVDGISLTINEVTEKEFQVTVIPYTAQVTTLGLKGIGATVNLECDLIGKHVEKLLQNSEPPARVTQEYLKKKRML
jgi:riboflavin synthase